MRCRYAASSQVLPPRGAVACNLRYKLIRHRYGYGSSETAEVRIVGFRSQRKIIEAFFASLGCRLQAQDLC